MTIKAAEQTAATNRTVAKGTPGSAAPARPKQGLGSDGLKLSAEASTAAQAKRERLADLAARAGIAAASSVGPVEKAIPGFLKRIGAGAALATSPIWAPIGTLARFGANLVSGLRNGSFAPASAFRDATREIAREFRADWNTAAGRSG